MKKQIISFLHIFIYLILALPICRAEEIISFKGFDRKDVPNLSLHLLSFPSLEEFKRNDIPFDAMVYFSQIDQSRYFSAHVQNTNPKNVYLDGDLNFVDMDNIPKDIVKSGKSNISVKFNRNNTVDIYRNFSIAHTLPFELSDSPGWYNYVVFNKSQSIVLFNSSSKELFFIYDIENPSIYKDKQNIQFDDIFSDKNSKTIFLYNYSRKKNRSLKISISKLDIFNNHYVDNLIQIDNCSTREKLYEYIGDLNLIIFGNERKLSTYDSYSGNLLYTVNLTAESLKMRKIFERQTNTLVVIGQDIINIADGQLLGVLPGLYPISAIEISPNNKYLLYSAPSKGLLITKLLCYSIDKNKITAEITLNNIGANPGHGRIHQIFFLSNDQLILLASSAILYPDHMHR